MEPQNNQQAPAPEQPITTPPMTVPTPVPPPVQPTVSAPKKWKLSIVTTNLIIFAIYSVIGLFLGQVTILLYLLHCLVLAIFSFVNLFINGERAAKFALATVVIFAVGFGYCTLVVTNGLAF